MNRSTSNHSWRDVLEFWFPEGCSLEIEAQIHRRHWLWRMRGGADSAIVTGFSERTEEAAAGGLDHWASEPGGRLALIIVLDQFSRSVWRGSARAFAQDPAALAWTMEGFANGHYSALPTPWCKTVYGLSLGHCEGADHLDRLDLLIELREEIAAAAPPHLQPLYSSLVKQVHQVRQVIAAFGRHPHRNHLLGRVSTAAEQRYLAAGKFPHLRLFEE